ncbi:MAG: DUF2796 domain-containing protein [Cyanobacteria bacterium J06642_2]
MQTRLKWLASGALVALCLVSAGRADAEGHEERRQFDSHVHGITNMNVAVENGTLDIEVDSPAANIVGFEHRPETAEQETAIAEALAQLEAGDVVFILPENAGCQLIEANAQTSFSEDGEGEHHHEDGEHHAEEGHGEGDHHDEHGDDEHGDDKHGDDEHHHEEGEHHAEDGEEGHGEEEHHHDEHGDGDKETHSEIAATYRFECDRPEQLMQMDVKLFEQFPGIEEIEVQLLSETGQTSVELTPEQAQLSF